MSTHSFLKTLLLIAITIILLMVAVAVSFAYGSNAEGKFFPVVRSGIVTILKQDGNSMTLLAGGNKVRVCEYLGTQAQIFRNGRWMRAELNIAPRFLTTTPLGVQTFGVYELRETDWERLSLTSLHRCHSLWTTVTTWVDVARVDIKHVKNP